MAKLYGSLADRRSPPLGAGWTGRSVPCHKTRGEHSGQYALKRVRNPRRRTRFESEIAAITRLSHPNFVRLIDYSALAETDEIDEKQYLVMPIAEGGDLSAPDRLSLYKDDIDAVLKVAFQIVSALQAAHAVNIIHRDVKPQNILFKGFGHDAWLTDFGICLLRDLPRFTDDTEVLGPRAFIAPELEEGGKLDVTPAADIRQGYLLHDQRGPDCVARVSSRGTFSADLRKT